MTTSESAVCRGCNRTLEGEPYHRGGRAFVPIETERRGPRREAKVCHYGGFVCSRECDVRACLRLEQTMPGHDYRQTRVGTFAMECIERNWGDRT